MRLRARDGLRLTGRWLVADEAGADGWVPDPHEAILLLHGWSGSVAPDLVEHGPFLRRTAGVLGLDFRGHGDSDDAPTTFGQREVEDVAGALAWLGERGIRRVALVGTSMGGMTAIAAVAVLGDGRLAAADMDPDAPAAAVAAPRPRIVAVVGDSVTPELSVAVARRLRVPLAQAMAERAFGRLARRVGGDPRDTEPIRAVTLLEDVPLLLVHGEADRTVPIRDGRRLAAAAPPGAQHWSSPARITGRVTRRIPHATRRRSRRTSGGVRGGSIGGGTLTASALYSARRLRGAGTTLVMTRCHSGRTDGRQDPRRRRRPERPATAPVHAQAGGLRGRHRGRRRRGAPVCGSRTRPR